MDGERTHADRRRNRRSEQGRLRSIVERLAVVFADAAQDNAKQVSDIENFLTQGVDLLVVSPNEAAPLTDEINKVWKSCIPVTG